MFFRVVTQMYSEVHLTPPFDGQSEYCWYFVENCNLVYFFCFLDSSTLVPCRTLLLFRRISRFSNGTRLGLNAVSGSRVVAVISGAFRGMLLFAEIAQIKWS